MSPNYREVSNEPKPSPLRPFIGFIILIVFAGISYFLSIPGLDVITTTSFSLPVVGSILPLTFPSEWPAIAHQAVVGAFIFFVLFIVFLIIALTFSAPTTNKDDAYVDLGDLRKKREQQKKDRIKAAKKARRRR